MPDALSDLLIVVGVLVFLGYLVRSYWRLWKRIGVRALWTFVPGTMPYYLAVALITGLIATVVSGLLSGWVGPWCILVLWPVFFFLWKYRDYRRVKRTGSASLKWYSLDDQSSPLHSATTAARAVPPKPRAIRRALGKFATGVGVFLFACMMMVFVTLAYSFKEVKEERAKIHIGMTAEEVLPAVQKYDMLAASSDAPRSGPADFSHSLNLGIDSNGLFHCQLGCMGEPPVLSAEAAAERMHQKLGDGYEWHWRYTYVNLTPQHISFNVIFGRDGRVKDVQAPYGWD